MKYKHIVFDIDGTLIDTEYAVLHSLQETIKGLSHQNGDCHIKDKGSQTNGNLFVICFN